MRRSIATPCPVSAQQLSTHELYTKDDTTTNFEFTTAFPSTLHSARPRRSGAAKSIGINFTIHEDQPPCEEKERASILAAQPPKRSHRPSLSSRAAEHSRYDLHKHSCGRTTSIAGAPGRFKPTVSTVPELARDKEPDVSGYAEPTITISRPLRRGTLYIPSDDTTQPSMWMGLFSPLKNDLDGSDNTSQQTQPNQITGIAAQMAAKRRRRSSMLATAPKRPPLQAHPSVPQEMVNNDARPGAPTGKENVAPGGLSSHKEESPERPSPARISQHTTSRRMSMQPKTKPVSRKSINPATFNRPAKQDRMRRSSVLDGRTLNTSAVTSDTLRQSTEVRSKQQFSDKQISPKVPSRFVHSCQRPAASIAPQMPLLENLPNTAMYEDNWLGHHELVVTMLINQLLEEPKSAPSISSTDTRHALLVKYNTGAMGVMHQRLKAACLHGPLSFTSEGLTHVHSLTTDIGRRKAFIKFWLDNYDTDALGIALEVVLGRQLPSSSDTTDLAGISTSSAKRKIIVRVIEAFLIRLDDISDASRRHNEGPAKAVQRCCMIIKALELLKEGATPIFAGCLFRKTAWVKTSQGAIQAIVQMLNPSIGDCLRLLRQLDFEVSHVQSPLDEIAFKVENLATELRDGALITRLVEVILYRDRRSDETALNESDYTTLSLPEGEFVNVAHRDDRPLTRHLKVPCISRASRLWNVEIALQSLRQVDSISKSIDGILADDIVDGYREKTMQLLWMLISQFGTNALIDEADVKQEIRRLRLHELSSDQKFRESTEHEAPQTEAEGLLKHWARAVAACKGLKVSNFTTSFSDGRIFETIVDEYHHYLSSHTSPTSTSLKDKLLNLGCSKQFAELFKTDASSQSHIFSADFVHAALVYLCNRLLKPSKLCRAAVVLQRAWRRRWVNMLRVRKQQMSKIASDCAAVVFDKDQRPLGRDRTEAVEVGNENTPVLEVGSDIWLSL